MLGRAVARYFRENGWDILTTSRRYTAEDSIAFVGEVVESRCEAVINCVGTTPGRARDVGELFNTNALLPQHLAAALGRERLFIHASSDGVFDGQRGGYEVTDQPNATDAYGLSKRLGELCAGLTRAVIFRTSIVGRESGPSRGLLEWFLSERTSVKGFDDQRWNGITTLTWAKLALSALQNPAELGPGTHQPASAVPVTKRGLLEAIRTASGHAREILACESGSPVDRTLVATIPCDPIDVQLAQLFAWDALVRGS
jgi:dTDP-4-dehydrorhamnose reductase